MRVCAATQERALHWLSMYASEVATKEKDLESLLRSRVTVQAKANYWLASSPFRAALRTKRLTNQETQFGVGDITEKFMPTSVKAAVGAAESSARQISDFVSKLNTIVMNFGTTSSIACYATILATNAVVLATHPDATTLGCVLLNTLVGLGIGPAIVKYALDMVTGSMAETPDPVPKFVSTDSGFKQVHGDDRLSGQRAQIMDPLNTGIGSLLGPFLDFDFTGIITKAMDCTSLLWSLCAAFFFLLAGALFSVPGDSLSKALPKFLTAFKRSADGFKCLQEVASWAVKQIQNLFYKLIYGISKEEYDLVQIMPKFEKFVKNTRTLQKLPGDAFMCSRQLCDKVKETYEIMRECEAHMMTNKKMIDRGSSTLFFFVEKKFLEIHENAKKSPHFDDVTRRQPLTCYIYGQSGVGKSQFVNLSTAVLARKMYPKKAFTSASVLWTRRTDNEFWDGYANQPFIQYDDFLQTIDTVSKPNPEIREMIDLVNDASLQLHMAELSQKSSSYFTSDHVWVSTNTKVPRPVSIAKPEALRRRFDNMAFEMKVNPKFGKLVKDPQTGYAYQRIDSAKVSNSFEKDVWRLHPYDLTSGNPELDNTGNEVVYTFDEFVDWYYNKWQALVTLHRGKSNKINEILGATPETHDQVIEKALKDMEDQISISTIGSAYMENPQLTPTAIEDNLTSVLNEVQGINPLSEDFDQEVELDEELLSLYDIYSARFPGLTSDTFEWCIEEEMRLNQFASTALGLDQVIINKMASDALHQKEEKFEEAEDEFEALLDAPKAMEQGVLSKMKDKLICAKDLAVGGFVKAYNLFRDGVLDTASKVKRSSALSVVLLTLTVLVGGITLWKLRGKCKVLNRAGAFASMCKSGCADCETVRKTCGASIMIDPKRAGMQIAEFNFSAYDILEAQGSTQDIKTKAGVEKEYWRDVFCCQLERSGQETQGMRVRSARGSRVNPTKGPKRPTFVEGYNALPTHRTRVEGYSRTPMFNQHVEGGFELTPELANMECQIGGEVRTFYDQMLKNVADPSLQQVLPAIVSNTCAMKIGSRFAIGVFVEGRVLLIPRHYMPWIEEQGKFTVKNMFADSPGQEVKLSDCKIEYLYVNEKETDSMLIALPLSVPSRRKISNKFVDSDQLSFVTESDVYLCRVRLAGERPILIIDRSSVRAHHEAKSKRGDGTYSYIRQAYTYEINTSPGDCGSIMITTSPSVARKIVGIHVSGNKTYGMAASVTKQMLDTALAKLPLHLLTSLPELRTEMSEYTYGDDYENLTDIGDIIHHGKVPNAPHQPTRTEIKPSPLQRIIEPKCKPAFLYPVRDSVDANTKRCPMLKGLAKVAKPQADVPDKLLDIAVSDIKGLMEVTKTVEPRVLSYEEAIVGVEGDEFINPLIRKTSAGYPWNTQAKFPGKHQWLSKIVDGKPTDEYRTDHPDLRREVMERLNQAKQNMRYPTYYVATLKDERRPIEKVNALKTRVFTAAPMDFTIAFRMYFSDFIGECMNNRIENEIAVGVDANTEWNYLAKYLLEYGDGGFVAGDFSNFDGSLLQKVLWRVLEIINAWYDDDDESQQIRRVLFEECCNSLVLCHGNVIQWTHSQPSGNPGTTIINSLFQMIMFRVCYLTMKLENNLPLVCDYRDNVRMITFGDDGVLNVHPRYRELFNQTRITEYMLMYGLTYTNEAKDDAAYTLRNLDGISFLKRKFRFENGLWYAPLDLEVIIEMCLWVKGPCVKAATHENVRNALVELALHGREVYDQYADFLARACWKTGIAIHKPTYLEVLDIREHLISPELFASVDPALLNHEVQGPLEVEEDKESDVLWQVQSLFYNAERERYLNLIEYDRWLDEGKLTKYVEPYRIQFTGEDCVNEHCKTTGQHAYPFLVREYTEDYDLEWMIAAWCFIATVFPHMLENVTTCLADFNQEQYVGYDGEFECRTWFYTPSHTITVTMFSLNHWSAGTTEVHLRKKGQTYNEGQRFEVLDPVSQVPAAVRVTR